MNRLTIRAKGSNLPHKWGHVQVSMRLSNEAFDKLKAIAIANYRTISAECALRIVQSLEAEAQQ